MKSFGTTHSETGVSTPSSAALRLARDEFAHLLGGRTPEAKWQTFFAANRFVLSTALPLRLLPCDIVPMGRPGFTEPDFILHPGSRLSANLHGVVELKTNYSKLVRRPRKNVLTLTRDAATAIGQVLAYSGTLDTFAPDRRILALDTTSHLFVIMGAMSELEGIEQSLLVDLRRTLPSGVRFIGYDELFEAFSREVPKPVSILYPDVPPAPPSIERLLFEPVRSYVAARLHTVTIEVVNSFNLGGPPDEDANFRHWLQMKMRNAGHYSSRFQPGDDGVVYAADSLDAALYDLNRYKQLWDVDRLTRTAHRHFEFEFSGEVLSLPDGPLSADVLAPNDYAAGNVLAQAARERGLDGVSYALPNGHGRRLALFSLGGIGRLITSQHLSS